MIIKFNLIRQEEKEIEKIEIKKFPFLKFYFSLIVFLFISLTMIFYEKSKTIKKLDSEKNEKQMILSKYKNIANKINKLEKENEEIKKRIETIVNLKKNQERELKKLAELLYESDSDKILLTNLKIDSNKGNIKGLSLDMDYLAYYMQSLEKKKDLIKEVILKTATQKESNEFKLIEFEIEVNYL